MASNQSVAQHFDPEERAFVAQAIDWLEMVENDYRIILTHFLNPRERHIVMTVLGDQMPIQVQEEGLFDRAEKARLVLAPDFMTIQEDDFDLCLLQLTFAKKFVTLRHKDLLGAFLSAGIDRATFGDIVVDANRGLAQVAVEKRYVPFIEQEIQQVGKVSANWQEVERNEALVPEVQGEERLVLLPSLRLDAVIAACFGLSRTEAKSLIDGGFVAVNWSKAMACDRSVRLKDVISVRKQGRICLQSLAGHSKRDKIKAVFQIIRR
ncbi:YlmH/Sll1252 family protein [Fructobacillus sp. M1-13]|uniref:Cell division protein n=1 Tax=Fructobacillus papyriferae TaxID=2713171 RepID=A0ABS5QN43_9LACO|nr:YlmH/Sll1252 family protein [Fructobacillus papyriferae]MBS9334509.1 cell division protein [Fructobacillus papyriferae]MCD2158498.1 YlmH/Sll1252 family protein [Fructobacillus papyriferae]